MCLEYVAVLCAVSLPCLDRISHVPSLGAFCLPSNICLLFLSACLNGEAFVRYLHLDKEPSDPGECVAMHMYTCLCVWYIVCVYVYVTVSVYTSASHTCA